MDYDSRTDELINRCVAELVQANAREHAQALIYRLRGMHYERALIEARRYIEQVLSCSEVAQRCGMSSVATVSSSASTSSAAMQMQLMM
jgi:hypothetical protein